MSINENYIYMYAASVSVCIMNVLRLCKQNSQVSSSISVLTDIETVLSYQSQFFFLHSFTQTTLSILFHVRLLHIPFLIYMDSIL